MFSVRVADFTLLPSFADVLMTRRDLSTSLQSRDYAASGDTGSSIRKPIEATVEVDREP